MARNYIKPVLSPEEAIKSVKEGMSVMIGGFNYGGVPYTLVEALEKAGTKGLTMISNDTSYATVGHGRLVAAGQIKKVIASHIGINKKTGEQYNAGTLELELVPQGTFVERIRCGGFGMGGFLTPTGLGTKVEEGKQVIEVDGKKYRAHKADRMGNLTYFGTNRNFNPTMATAADLVIAEVDSIVEVGELDPNNIVTPGILVDILVVKGDNYYAART